MTSTVRMSATKDKLLTLANLLSLSIFLTLVCRSDCLYEDQIGKFDWRQTFVGKVKYASFDALSNDRILVGTEEHVIAAVSAKSSELLWRQVYENHPRGDIKLFHAIPELHGPTSAAEVTVRRDSVSLMTVSGSSPAIVRGWNPNTGILQWEWSMLPSMPDFATDAVWFYANQQLYHVVPVWSSHIEVTAYVANTGHQLRVGSTRVNAAWIVKERCTLAGTFFACTVNGQVIAVNMAETGDVLFTQELRQPVESAPKAIRGCDSVIIVGNEIISLRRQPTAYAAKSEAVYFCDTTLGSNEILIEVIVDNAILRISAVELSTGNPFDDLIMMADYPSQTGRPEIMAVRCKSKSETGTMAACRMLLSSDDGALMLLQQGKLKWVREEALAQVVAVDIIDLSFSDDQGAIENEFKNKDGNIFGAFSRRLTSQFIQIRNLMLTVLGFGAPQSATERAGLVRDSFGLHKMVVAVTAVGKIYGIDNMSGKQHWVKYFPHFVGFADTEPMKLLVQRTSKHFPHAPQCVIVARHRQTGNGLVYQFNPISGEPINGGFVELPLPIQQVTLLQVTGPDFLRGILILDEMNRPTVIPAQKSLQANGMHLFTANMETGTVTGYLIKYTNQELVAIPTWQINLNGTYSTQKLIKIASKNPIEHVHSQGRVLSDRSVLYKYINPNLVAFATQGPDTVHKYVMNVYLIDVVSGAIVFSMSHKKVTGPVHMVHSENWLVYTYHNDKVRRPELTTVELYEGKTQANSTVWSSWSNTPEPLVERQSYIIPGTVTALKETITEKGITNKDVLIGLATGGVVEMPWAFLDPRRPVTMQNQAREEGSIPYMPELPLPSESIINYNLSIARIRDIFTAPSGLESTCLVVVVGLDLFVTRVSPSKTFDLLKEDFDYFLIGVVLIVLTQASYVVKHLSSRKALKQAWK